MKIAKNKNETFCICDCGTILPFKATVIMTNSTRKCPCCQKEHYLDVSPINWDIILKNNRGELSVR